MRQRWSRSSRSRTSRTPALLIALSCLALGVGVPAASAAAPGWSLEITPLPANFAPGQESEYAVVAANVGAAPTSGAEIEVKTTVPESWTISSFNSFVTDPAVKAPLACAVAASTLACKTSAVIHPGYLIRIKVGVGVPSGAPEEVLDSTATVSGGGAAPPVSAGSPTPVQSGPVPFGFLPGFKAPVTDQEAKAELLAGAHPYQQTVSFGFPTKNPGDGITNDGHPRDFYVDLPRGMAGLPGATKVLCTEAELVGSGCPDASQVGVTDVTTLAGEVGISDVLTSNLYNMVPPPGSAAEVATNVANIGVFVHAQGSLRSASDYGVRVATRDVIAFGQQPIFNVQAQVWGDPSSPAHDEIRGQCGTFGGKCPVAEREEAFLAMPVQCTGEPSLFEVLADTWEEPQAQGFDLYRASYESAGLGGEAAILEGCEELEFEPTIQARPTTDVSDSPSGLDFTLRQPTETAFGSRSEAILKDAVVSLPRGMVVNPSQAGGLGACSLAQIGYLNSAGGAPHFSEDPQSCPDASKLGTVEVTSPALVRRNAAHEVEEEEGEAIEEPLRGAIYLARPFQNPFGKLIAVYLAIEDQKTGIVAKLAGEGRLDPQSGQVTTVFKESPEMPLGEVGVHLFGGPRGSELRSEAGAGDGEKPIAAMHGKASGSEREILESASRIA